MKKLLKMLLGNPLFMSQIKHYSRIFNTHEKILQQGKVYNSFFFIKKGNVRVILHKKMDTKIHIHPSIIDLGPEDIFGEFGLFDNLPASADVVALNQSELVEIDKASFIRFLEQNPKIGYNIMLYLLQSLTKRLRQADKTIINLYAWGVKAHQIDKYLEK
jgi:CRP/FNR family transcriptional regulator, cyclic AMP receptor protein